MRAEAEALMADAEPEPFVVAESEPPVLADVEPEAPLLAAHTHT